MTALDGFDHDLHIHTFLSRCCKTPWESFPENIVRRAAEAGLKTIGLADHLWDSAVSGATQWYAVQDLEYVSQIRRLVPGDTRGVRVLVGCETEIRGDGTVCLTPQAAEKMDFVLIPHSHLHIKGNLPAGVSTPRQLADLLADRFLRSLDAPFITGIPHAFIPAKHEDKADAVIDCLSAGQLQDCFGKAAQRGAAIEITPNFFPSLKGHVAPPFHEESYLHVLTVAKQAGCRFYLGSDAHTLARVGATAGLLPYVERLGIISADLHPLVRSRE